jgi:hypothetical protein
MPLNPITIACRGCVMVLHLLTGDGSVSRLHGCSNLGRFDEWTFLVLVDVISAGEWILF